MSVEGWLKQSVKDICDLGRGRVISTQEIELHTGIYPVFSSQSQDKGEMGKIDTYDFEGEYITWTTDGAYAGTVFYRTGKFNCTNVCGTLKAKNRQLSMKFLAYKLSSLTKNYVSYVGNPKLMNNVMANIELSLPESQAEQTQIATILSTIDRAIEQTEALITKQQRIKTGLMQDLLTKGIDENGNIRSEETHKFKDSPLGRIPVEWEVKEIGKVASLQRGYDIREIDFLPGNFPVIASSGIIGFHKFRTSIGPNVVVGRKGSIGNVYYIGLDFWAHDTSLFVTNFFGNHERYIYYLFVYLELERFGTKSGSPSLNRNDIHPLLVSIPNPNEQIEIARIIYNCDELLTTLSKELEKNKLQKTGLMQDLLTGKVRVTDLLNQKTATN